MQTRDLDLLKGFLLNAKRATYAAQTGVASVRPLLEDAKQLEYRDGDFFYRDIYVGMLHFVGQEIAYASGRAVWSMSYAGGLTPAADAGAARSIYGLLRQALRVAPPELPIRGPASLQSEMGCYTCEVAGTFERFHGVETITRAERLYEVFFSGGCIA